MMVALVNMPFADVDLPSLGLSLLKAHLARDNIHADVYYLNHWFAGRVGRSRYCRLSSGAPMVHDLSGEWVFAEALWGADIQRDADYLHFVASGASPHHAKRWQPDERDSHIRDLAGARSEVAPFLGRCLTEIDWNQYEVVGFSSMFQQNVASLALAGALKLRHPELIIIFGGANCEGPMGEALLRCFPYVDAVCNGEGDQCFPAFVKGILEGQSLPTVPGIRNRTAAGGGPHHGAAGVTTGGLVGNLDGLPYPNFDDYFGQCQQDQSTEFSAPHIMIESSRGCWWGARSHCTFCGLNANAMAYRQKTAARSLRELEWLVDRYGRHTRKVVATDNIMPHNFLREFFPRLKELGLEVELFYESKANLKREHVRLLRDAGVSRFQPGIESLVTTVLRLMRKGVTGLQNVQLLKWCCEMGVEPDWNYLVGFPNERPDDYAKQPDWIRSVEHLPPPNYCGRIRFDRFSPYVNEPFSFGLTSLAPYPAYGFVYPSLSESDLCDIAYFFTAEFEGQSQIDCYTTELRAAVAEWHHQSTTSYLFGFATSDDTLEIVDTRRVAVEQVFSVSGWLRFVLELTERVTTRAKIIEQAYAWNPQAESDVGPLLEKALLWLTDRRLILWDDNQCLSLVVRVDGAGGEYKGPRRDQSPVLSSESTVNTL